MAPTANQLREQPNLPPAVKTELLDSTDEKIDDAWNGIVEHLERQVNADTIVQKLEAKGRSYDTAYWLVNHARLHGPTKKNPHASNRYSARRAIAIGMIVLGVVAFVASNRAEAGVLPALAALGLIAFGIFLVRRIPRV